MVELTKNDLTANCNEELENAIYALYGKANEGIEASYEINGVTITSKEAETNDINWFFQKVYGKSYNEYVADREEGKRETYINMGMEVISKDKEELWTKYVDDYLEYAYFYHVGHPVKDALKAIMVVNEIENDEDLIQVINNYDGSNKTLLNAIINFSNKGERVQQLYEQLSTRDEGTEGKKLN